MELLDTQNMVLLFTDASTTTYGNETISGYGSIRCVNGETSETYLLERNSTSNRGELLAILRGIQNSIEYARRGYPFIIFTDSLLSCNILRDYMSKWKLNGSTLYKNNNTEVLNSDILVDIMRYVIYFNISLEIFHISGHVNLNNREDFKKAYYKFIKFNNINTQMVQKEFIENTVYTACQFNNLVDRKSRRCLHDMLNANKDINFISPLSILVNDLSIEEFTKRVQ